MPWVSVPGDNALNLDSVGPANIPLQSQILSSSVDSSHAGMLTVYCSSWKEAQSRPSPRGPRGFLQSRQNQIQMTQLHPTLGTGSGSCTNHWHLVNIGGTKRIHNNNLTVLFFRTLSNLALWNIFYISITHPLAILSFQCTVCSLKYINFSIRQICALVQYFSSLSLYPLSRYSNNFH